MNGRVWTKEEEIFLINHIDTMSIKDIATKIERSPGTTSNKARKLGLKIKRINKWTQEDLEYLKTNVRVYSDEEIALNLNRSTVAVQVKITALKLRPHRKIINGERFGRLTIIEKTVKKNKHGTFYYLCKCDCGNIKEIDRNVLIRGHTKSCGCLATEVRTNKNLKEKGKAAIGKLYNGFRKGSCRRGRNIGFNLTIEDFEVLIFKDCYYCGSKPIPYNPYLTKEGTQSKGIKHNISQNTIDRAWISVNGIDRLDNNKSYTIDNCVPCCWPCNEMKMDRTEEEFIAHAHKIVAFQEGKKQKC